MNKELIKRLPEYVDLEIVLDNTERWLGVYDKNCNTFLPFGFTHLHCLSSLPNFKEFWYETEKGNNWYFTNDGLVATYIDEGKKVFARFRK